MIYIMFFPSCPCYFCLIKLYKNEKIAYQYDIARRVDGLELW